jgi:hypothetical protein
MTELERRSAKLEAARGNRPTPEEQAAFAALAEALDSLARRIARRATKRREPKLRRWWRHCHLAPPGREGRRAALPDWRIRGIRNAPCLHAVKGAAARPMSHKSHVSHAPVAGHEGGRPPFTFKVERRGFVGLVGLVGGRGT